MKKSSCLIVAVASLAGLLCLPATAMEVYKWVDENGGVHYSEAPPPSDAKSKGTVKVNTRLPADAAQEQAQRQKDLEKADKDRKTNTDKAKQAAASDKDKADKAEQNKDTCNQLRANQQVMNEHGRVRTTDANGDTHYMTDEEKQKSMEDTQKQIDAFCNS